jgi:predicted RNA-binding protein with PIN domain
MMIRVYNDEMQYLVDGHNLVPKLGLRLDSVDDENELISRLQQFYLLRRAKVEVYFDGAPPGQASTRQYGAIKAHFVSRESSADAAIELRLEKLGKAAKNWVLVSSDGRLQRAAKAVHTGVLSSEGFALEMSKAQELKVSSLKQDATLSPGEIEEWLIIFNRKRG